MSKFTVGDRVRAIRRKNGFFNDSWLTEGQVYTVEGVYAAAGVVVVYSDKYAMTGGFRYEDFEHVDAKAAESELERLVRVANEGQKACVELRKFKDSVEYLSLGLGWLPIASEFRADEYRIKPKPTFEPFTVGNGWQVRLEGDTLHIGCQTFPAKKLKQGLYCLCKESGAMTDSGSGKIQAMRGYVEHASGNRISWSDADKILAALEKAGF